MKKSKTFSYVAGFVSRFACTSANAVTIATVLNVPGEPLSVIPALGYVAVSLGLASWDSIEKYIADQTSDSLECLINLIRAGEHLAADDISRIESKNSDAESKLSGIDTFLDSLPVNDGRRPSLVFYRLLKLIESRGNDSSGRIVEECRNTEERLRREIQSNESCFKSYFLSCLQHFEHFEETLVKLGERHDALKEDLNESLSVLQSGFARLHRGTIHEGREPLVFRESPI